MSSLRQLSDMSNRVALITGGAGHLGLAMGEALAEAGTSVIIIDLNQAMIDKAITHLTNNYGGTHCGFLVDLSDEKAIASIPEWLSRSYEHLDVLINCAALVGSSELKGWATPFKQQEVGTWKKALDVNMTAAFSLIQYCLPLLERSQSPSIINVSSIYGVAGQKMALYSGMDYLTPAAYAASKGALVQLTKYLATVLAPIRTNCISPGGIERGQDEAFQERYKQLTPLGRMACEGDFKGACHFLASDLSRYITGQNIIVDGGWSL
ncbi:SDR family oxidoreductase [Endozoicomonas ascidiicola]|uniref:SDR family oxidoreductase n=1 Tax=Endozoicomonas ascidiicola TaxID=1698521 RepID=UPI00082A5215|nr:SDR family oxidoreductase [Endozoicomonas ascidiicola]